LISLADTCNIDALYFLKQRMGAKLLIPPSVYDESIARPLKVWRYEFSAVRIMKAFQDKVLELVEAPELDKEAKAIVDSANALFEVDGKPLKILHEGEAQCLAALALAPNAALLVDEKTTRLLIEAPELLLKTLKSEYSGEVKIKEDVLEDLRAITLGTRALRSSEVLAIAGRRGYFSSYGKISDEAFHASLAALKSAGCSISFDELKEYAEITP
jgi:predicted nucleic acid-binding protein